MKLLELIVATLHFSLIIWFAFCVVSAAGIFLWCFYSGDWLFYLRKLKRLDFRELIKFLGLSYIYSLVVVITAMTRGLILLPILIGLFFTNVGD